MARCLCRNMGNAKKIIENGCTETFVMLRGCMSRNTPFVAQFEISTEMHIVLSKGKMG